MQDGLEDTEEGKEDNEKKVESGADGVDVGKEWRVDGNVTGNGGGTGSPFWTCVVRHSSTIAAQRSSECVTLAQHGGLLLAVRS